MTRDQQIVVAGIGLVAAAAAYDDLSDGRIPSPRILIGGLIAAAGLAALTDRAPGIAKGLTAMLLISAAALYVDNLTSIANRLAEGIETP